MTPNELLKEIEQHDFDYFISEMLNRVPDSIDKREGSIIYDALAPAAYNMAEMAHKYHEQLLNTYTQTATGEFLDYRAAERGIQRKLATNSIVLASFLDSDGHEMDVDLNTRFASVGVTPIYYKVIERQSKGVYQMSAEQPGSGANQYVGQVLPISNINGFGYGEIKSVEIPARDSESDSELRERILESNEFTQYGGNVQDYIAMIKKLNEVGAVQVYPTWNGAGTVKLVIVGNDYNLPSRTLLEKVQNEIDPTDESGNGYGIAPIGHQVTVVAPSSRTLDFVVSLELEEGVNGSDVKTAVNDSINRFIQELKKDRWATLKNERTYQMTVYISQIMATLLKIPGVLNVSGLSINGAAKDVPLVFTNQLQELPVVGEVAINA